MKTSFVIGIVVFWSVVVVLSIAGLVAYENQKMLDTLTGTQGTATGSTMVLDDTAQSMAAQQGITTWQPELVALHDTLDDCWLTINDAIYNVTEYVPFHPGGSDTIRPSCGAEATEAFATKGGEGNDHSASAYAMLDTYRVAAIGDPLPQSGSGSGGASDTPTQTTQTDTPAAVPPAAAPPVVSTPAPVAPTTENLTAATVANHATLADCWLIINNNVYDVTSYVPFHPGGENTIRPWCGKESTNAFATKGGGGGDHSQSAYSQLDRYLIGALGTAVPTNAPEPASIDTASAPVPDGALTAADVVGHNSVSDCWLIISNRVYDVTQYIPMHPGGTNTIRPYCGKESTQAFTNRGGDGRHSTNAWNMLENYYIGDFAGGTEGAGGVSVAAPPDPTEPYREAILDEYPSATSIEIKLEDDGRAEIEFRLDGQEYEGTMNSNYEIVKLEDD
jgi:cytochrome b involved in lipid metabolism